MFEPFRAKFTRMVAELRSDDSLSVEARVEEFAEE